MESYYILAQWWIDLDCWALFCMGNWISNQVTVFPLISDAPLGMDIEISASSLISAATLNTALIRIVTIS